MKVYDTIRRKTEKFSGKSVIVSGDNEFYGKTGVISQMRADIEGESFELYFTVSFGKFSAILHEREVTILL